jgi:hypothetical protein
VPETEHGVEQCGHIHSIRYRDIPVAACTQPQTKKWPTALLFVSEQEAPSPSQVAVTRAQETGTRVSHRSVVPEADDAHATLLT